MRNRAQPPPTLREGTVLVALIGLVAALPIVRLAWETGGVASVQRALVLHGGDLVRDGGTILAAALLAGILAWLVAEREGQPSRARALFGWWPLCVSGSALGVALIALYNRSALDFVYTTRGILVVAAIARWFPVALFAVEARLRAVGRGQWEAADLSGSPCAARVLRVDLPLAMEGILVGAVAVATLSSGEVACAVLVASPGSWPVALSIASQLHYNVDLDVPAALCLLQASVGLAVCAGLSTGAWFVTRIVRRIV